MAQGQRSPSNTVSGPRKVILLRNQTAEYHSMVTRQRWRLGLTLCRLSIKVMCNCLHQPPESQDGRLLALLKMAKTVYSCRNLVEFALIERLKFRDPKMRTTRCEMRHSTIHPAAKEVYKLRIQAMNNLNLLLWRSFRDARTNAFRRLFLNESEVHSYCRANTRDDPTTEPVQSLTVQLSQ